VKPVVAIVAPGSMGAALGRRLVEHGVSVLTSLEDRSEVSRRRAAEAGLRSVQPAELLDADFLLSVVPPGAALQFAERVAGLLRAARHKPTFVDCNAVSPVTLARIATAISDAGAPFLDAGIIGFPPRAAAAGPHIYACGPQVERLRVLCDFGLEIRLLDGPLGTASALKMAYAGITKGIVAVGTSMLLAAERAGVAAPLRAELLESQASVLAGYARSIPGMFGKAYRWVAEMQEIASFAGDDPAAVQLFSAAAALYERLAADVAGERREAMTLERLLEPPPAR